MRTAVLVAILLGAIASSRAGSVVIASPDRARTFAYGEMVWRQLSVDRATNRLTARVTFSNLPYAGGEVSRVDEPFDFRFQGTYVDAASQTIVVRDRRGQSIRIARFRGNPADGWIHLTPEAKIYLLKESGRVTALLTATSEPRPGMRWIQMDNNWSLQNLLASLCRR